MANMTFKANLLPDNTAAQRELGSSTAKWAINGVADPKLTDTLPTINTTGTGNAITAVSISGSTITVTKGSTFPNSDTLVKQTAKTDNVEYKILTTASASPVSGNAAEVAYGTDFTINPSLKAITAPNFKVTNNATITYNTTTGCLEVIV